MPISLRFRDQVFLLFLPGLILLFGIGLFSYQSNLAFVDTADWVNHTSVVIAQTSAIKSALETAESDQRGYVLTGSPLMKASAESAMRETQSALKELENLTQDNPEQRLRLKSLSEAFAQRFNFLSRGLEIRSSHPGEDAVRIFNQQIGVAGFNATQRCLQILAEITKAEELLRTTRNTEFMHRASSTQRNILLSSLFGMICFLLAYLFLRREFHIRKQVAEQFKLAHTTAMTAISTRANFLSSMSHELRTPLNSIIGMSEVLLDDPTENERKKITLIIQRAGNLLLNLISDILDMATIEDGKIELQSSEFDLAELVDTTASMISFRASQKGLPLSYSIDPDAPTHLLGDPGRIRQILLNLLGNAIKFTEQGSIILNVETAPGAAKGTEFIRFTVSDTGPGISEAVKVGLFDRTHDTDPSITPGFGRKGLGLSIAKQLVDRMGGKIWVDSVLGEGSTFFVQLPLVVLEQTLTLKNTARSQAKDSRPLHILVADDVEDNRLLIQLYLKQQPYHLDFASDGLQVLDQCGKQKFDLILLDMHMPHLSGYQAAEQIRADEKSTGSDRTPIIALTAYAMKEDALRSIEAGCDRHLTKPITRETLLRAISESIPRTDGGENLDHTPQLYLKKDLAPLIPAFLENRKKELERLSAAIQNKNFDEIHDIGHMIKGVSGTFGFGELSDLCRDLQTQSKSKNLPELEAIRQRAKTYLDQVKIHFV